MQNPYIKSQDRRATSYHDISAIFTVAPYIITKRFSNLTWSSFFLEDLTPTFYF